MTTTAIANVVAQTTDTAAQLAAQTPAQAQAAQDAQSLLLAVAFTGAQLPDATSVPATSPAPASPAAATAPQPSATISSAPAPAPSWIKIAAEGQSFTESKATLVRFGAGNGWISKTVTGTGACTNTFFGSDPSYGNVKECDIQGTGTAPPPAPPPSLPYIDVKTIPVSPVGYSDARVKAANVADPSQVPSPTTIGSFREPCGFSHMNFDDPIVLPGQPGKSHLHTYFGNTGTNANTTAASLAGSGNSTCAGGTLNRTGYWVPTLIDTRTGRAIQPKGSIFYYKTGYNGLAPAIMHALPQGLRMVSGSSSGTPANTSNYAPFRYGCVGPSGSPSSATYWAGHAIPNCAVGSDMLMEVDFPQCWDGVNLDSPDHKSHMANPTNGVCPATHPVAVPEISFEIHYGVAASDMTSKWRLSSDMYDTTSPGGYSGHGDWFNGWDTPTMATFVKYCEQTPLDCHAYLLGNGQTLY